jgi:hypothetical protein
VHKKLLDDGVYTQEEYEQAQKDAREIYIGEKQHAKEQD